MLPCATNSAHGPAAVPRYQCYQWTCPCPYGWDRGLVLGAKDRMWRLAIASRLICSQGGMHKDSCHIGFIRFTETSVGVGHLPLRALSMAWLIEPGLPAPSACKPKRSCGRAYSGLDFKLDCDQFPFVFIRCLWLTCLGRRGHSCRSCLSCKSSEMGTHPSLDSASQTRAAIDPHFTFGPLF